VSLAAAEVGLELDDRVAAGAGQAGEGADEELAEALGEEGAAEELGGVAVLVGALVLVDLPQVGGELGLLVAAGGDVGVGRDDLAPGGRPPWGLPSVGWKEALRISERRCSSNWSRRRSMRICSASAAWGAETAERRRPMVSRAR
jgi:hypothetical protein